MLPNFIIIGSMKCGTTSLTTYLSQHKEVFISNPQKLYYFSSDENYSKGIKYYESFFDNVRDELAIGEGCDDYSKGLNNKSARASVRIREMIPECKLIFLAKHPIKQIESQWLQRSANSAERLPFNEAILHSQYDYIENANYKKQLQFYIDIFPNSQIQVYFTEDFALNPSNIVKSCLSFLDVNPSIEGINFERQNISFNKAYYRSLTSLLRKNEFINKIAKKASPNIKNLLKKVFTKKRSYKPDWDQEALSYVLNTIWEFYTTSRISVIQIYLSY